MRKGIKAIFMIGDYSYDISHFKINDSDAQYFCGSLELTISDSVYPDVDPNESYNARLYVNGDAVWYFPWLWFEKPDNLPKMSAVTNGAIFCPFGLSEEDEAKYEAINSLLSIDAGKDIPMDMWKSLLLICGDWLLDRSIPQSKEFTKFAEEIEIENEKEEE